MTTAVLDQFRRRFLATTIRKRDVGILSEDQLAALRTESIKPNDSVLLFRSNFELLKAVAQRAGPGSVIFNIDNDPSRVTELRQQLAATKPLECEATIRCVCADWSDLRSNLEWSQLKLEEEPVHSVFELVHFRDGLNFSSAGKPSDS